MAARRAKSAGKDTLLIACGALAREIIELIRVNGWRHLDVTCLPAHLHNSPQLIPEAVRGKIAEAKGRYDRVAVVYGDCGTGGMLDAVLQEEGVERIAGPHCYQFYAGAEVFTRLADDEPGTFYLTDYLVRHFDRLVLQGLGLDRFPQLLPDYFGHYSRLIYLAQTEDADLQLAAHQAAERLGLAYEYRFTGYGELSDFLAEAEATSEHAGTPTRRTA
jgi:hypothetical protein